MYFRLWQIQVPFHFFYLIKCPHFLPKTKMLTVKVNVPLEESALQLLYDALEILAKNIVFEL